MGLFTQRLSRAADKMVYFENAPCPKSTGLQLHQTQLFLGFEIMLDDKVILVMPVYFIILKVDDKSFFVREIFFF